MKAIISIRDILTKAKPYLLWLVGAFLAEDFIRNGIRKFDVDGFWGPAFQRWGYPVWFMFLIGGLEVLGGVILLIPKIRHWGAWILGVIMIGALVTRAIYGVSRGDVFFFISTIALLLYLSARHETRQQENNE